MMYKITSFYQKQLRCKSIVATYVNGYLELGQEPRLLEHAYNGLERLVVVQHEIVEVVVVEAQLVPRRKFGFLPGGKHNV